MDQPDLWLYVAVVMGIAALALAFFYARQVTSAEPGNAVMVDLMGAIRKGSMAFLKREYRAVAVFVVILAALILIAPAGWAARPSTCGPTRAATTSLATCSRTGRLSKRRSRSAGRARDGGTGPVR